MKLSNVAKVEIVSNLIRNIRNRTFHWENLYRTTTKSIKGKEVSYPRITHKENGTNIEISPDKILVFFDGLIGKTGNAEMGKYKDLEIRYKGI